jgi:hypothetical protein
MLEAFYLWAFLLKMCDVRLKIGKFYVEIFIKTECKFISYIFKLSYNGTY